MEWIHGRSNIDIDHGSIEADRMDLHVSLATGELSTGVYAQLRAAVLDGRLRPGDALPATRELARRLAVSRNTVTNAYQRLIAEGFAVGRVGAGTFVSADVPALR